MAYCECWSRSSHPLVSCYRNHECRTQYNPLGAHTHEHWHDWPYKWEAKRCARVCVVFCAFASTHMRLLLCKHEREKFSEKSSGCIREERGKWNSRDITLDFTYDRRSADSTRDVFLFISNTTLKNIFYVRWTAYSLSPVIYTTCSCGKLYYIIRRVFSTYFGVRCIFHLFAFWCTLHWINFILHTVLALVKDFGIRSIQNFRWYSNLTFA